MLVVAQHPCPIRWRPPRGRERVSYLALRTPIEIPEVEAGAMDRDRRSYDDGRISGSFSVYQDSCWEPVHLARYRMSRDGAATAAELAADLAHRTDLPHGISVPGSPLCGAKLGDVETRLQGEDLPASVLTKAVDDPSDAVRSAFRAWAESSLLIVGGTAFVARPMPAYLPQTRNAHPAAHRSPLTWEQGAAFEAGRIPLYGAYLRAARLVEGADAPSARFASRMSGLPDTREDLRLFANAAPREALAALERAALRMRQHGDALPDLGAWFSPLVPLADLGLVRAVPEARFREVADRVSAALGALSRQLPAGYGPTALRQLLAYADHVARPSLPPPPIPEADADSLSWLAPR